MTQSYEKILHPSNKSITTSKGKVMRFFNEPFSHFVRCAWEDGGVVPVALRGEYTSVSEAYKAAKSYIDTVEANSKPKKATKVTK